MNLAAPPVFDAHVDSIQRALDMGHDLGDWTPGHLDLVRGQMGGLGAVVMTAWVDPEFLQPAKGGAPARAHALIAALHTLARRRSNLAAWVGNGAELARVRQSGRTALIAAIEGGHAIDGNLDRLQDFFEFGVRILTLVWNNHLPWIRSCQPNAGPDVPAGLSPFGREVVRRMNRLGVLVDVSHAAERAVLDVLDVSDRPVIASHSACAALSRHPRNLSDATLRCIAQHGGVLGIVFCTPFLDEQARAEEARLRLRAEYRNLRGANGTATEALQSEYLQRQATAFPMETVVRHVLHAIDVMGIDHVGLGSDFDGIQRTPAEIADASAYPNLAQALVRAGLSPADVEKVFWGNMTRVFDWATGPGTVAAQASLRPVGASWTSEHIG
ncbi:MAG: membrane dipeptidase [Planctomycetes bacterium]|nr:membrane dipeptidase [Planctomycetota bacterium]MCB9910932.1 membrane dipeptidase [Planctomycetota bacterium]MCB9911601.1 membrane dipeptidase [Planctomycetota bacterium]HPF15707.1 dipeptidase [Planctomycetota bacterium]